MDKLIETPLQGCPTNNEESIGINNINDSIDHNYD